MDYETNQSDFENAEIKALVEVDPLRAKRDEVPARQLETIKTLEVRRREKFLSEQFARLKNSPDFEQTVKAAIELAYKIDLMNTEAVFADEETAKLVERFAAAFTGKTYEAARL